MRAKHIEAIGQELAIKWENGTETFLPLQKLREHCPCAGCKGEADIMGKVYKAEAKPLSPASYQLRSLQFIGGYAIQPTWADGHNTGLFTFDYLARLAQE